MLRRALVFAAVLAGTSLFAPPALAQKLRVRSDSVTPVPFAVVSVGGANERVADANGEVSITLPARGPADLRVRRVGYREFRGAPSTDALGPYVTLQPIAIQLDTVMSTARANTPLARTGFYDRMERVQRGAIVGEFVTPEQLEDRVASNTSDYLRGRRYARIDGMMVGGRRRLVVLGRAACAMTILVDGQRVPNLWGEGMSSDAPTSIVGGGTGGLGHTSTRIDIDEAVNGKAIMAIELYPSTANAPAELQTLGGRGSCGIVALWTGPRY